MSSQTALERLRDPEQQATKALARLLVDDALDTPMAELVRPDWLASQLAAGLEAATRTDRLRELAQQALDEAMARWGHSDAALRSEVPEELVEPLLKALSHPYVPSEELVWRILDQPVFMSLMSEVLENSFKGFRSRMSGVDDKLLGGFGRRAAKRGRGLFGGVAESVVGAVAGEVEHQFDRRLSEFLSKATGEALRVVARHVADQAHAESYAEVRTGIFNTVMDIPIKELAAEALDARPMAYVDVVLQGLTGAIAADSFVDDTTRRLQTLMDEVGTGTFGAWLEEVGLRDVWTESTVELLAERLSSTVQTDAFAAWWTDLHAAP